MLAGCRHPGPVPPDAAASRAPRTTRATSRLEVGWDPRSGRGDVRHVLGSGDRLRTCFHCDYPGYTGGLVIGAFNGSGMGFYPRRPIRGYRAINLFCAQDESIWDRDERAEYSYGWSENFGTGPDGRRLGYVRGRVLERGPDRVVLQSENAGGCYRVTKVAATRAGARYWILATRITNTCAHPVHFDFFTGDDPWLGRYRSSDGDVGWTSEGLIERERALVPFTVGGIYDLGNRTLGQTATSFSNQANFIALDPAVPPPDRAYVANRFAHADRDIDPKRALDNRSMTALNLGWTGRTVAPGCGFTVALAAGLAETGAPGTIPRAPAIPDEDWSVWRRYLKEPSCTPRTTAPELAAEEVALDLRRDALDVAGTYYVRNPGDAPVSITIRYPILVARTRPAPATVEVDGRALPVRATAAGEAVAAFPLAVPARGLARFSVRYTQEHHGREAVYLVTSARRWPTPVGRAVFTVRHPASLGRVRLSYPATRTWRSGDVVHDTIVLRDFAPTRELTMRW